MSFFNKFRVAVKSPRSTKPPVAMEISGPCDMRHEIHVGWDNDGVLQGMPESWRQWMKAANIGYLNFLSVLMAIFQVNLPQLASARMSPFWISLELRVMDVVEL